MNKKFLIGMVVLLSVSLFFFGCDPETTVPDLERSQVDTAGLDLTSLFYAPDAALTSANYTGVITWTPALAEGKTTFAAYTAASDRTFAGIAVNAFYYTGAGVTNPAGAGDMITVTVVFPTTAGTGDSPATVNGAALVLTSRVTRPVTGETAQPTFANTIWYTGTITWKTDEDAMHNGPFAATSVYKAVLSLTAETGYTFNGEVMV
jgi:hypothetical protein